MFFFCCFFVPVVPTIPKLKFPNPEIFLTNITNLIVVCYVIYSHALNLITPKYVVLVTIQLLTITTSSLDSSITHYLSSNRIYMLWCALIHHSSESYFNTKQMLICWSQFGWVLWYIFTSIVINHIWITPTHSNNSINWTLCPPQTIPYSQGIDCSIRDRHCRNCWKSTITSTLHTCNIIETRFVRICSYSLAPINRVNWLIALNIMYSSVEDIFILPERN